MGNKPTNHCTFLIKKDLADSPSSPFQHSPLIHHLNPSSSSSSLASGLALFQSSMATKMAIRASAIPRHHPPPSLPSSSHRSDSKSQFRPISVSLPASTTLSLLALFSSPYEARALNKDQIVSSLNEVSIIVILFNVNGRFIEPNC